MGPVIEMQPDALIMADPGLIMLVRERWPDMPIHLSVQANTVNAAGVKFWQNIGLTRIILSRELSLDEIAAIRQACPDIELEVFVHGALCIAYSGRCLLSGYFNHRDANQGTCTNACRWDYKIAKEELDAVSNQDSGIATVALSEVKRHPEADKVYYLEEQNRPGEFMPIFEDEHGTYIMNSKDLRAVEHIQRLTDIGIDCLKIEGRTKSHYYTARTAQVYRQAIEDAVAGRAFNPHLMGELENLASRGYTDGFFQRHPSDQMQSYRQGASAADKSQFVAEVTGMDQSTGLAELTVKNKFAVGDQLELITPSGNHRFQLERLFDQAGQTLDTAPGSGWVVQTPLPAVAEQHGLVSRFL